MATCAIICDWCKHFLEQSSDKHIFKCRECLTKICKDCHDAKAEEICAGGKNKYLLNVVPGNVPTGQNTNFNQCHSRVNFTCVPNTATRGSKIVKKKPDFQNDGTFVKLDFNFPST